MNFHSEISRVDCIHFHEERRKKEKKNITYHINPIKCSGALHFMKGEASSAANQLLPNTSDKQY